jgi:hypothetical protein
MCRKIEFKRAITNQSMAVFEIEIDETQKNHPDIEKTSQAISKIFENSTDRNAEKIKQEISKLQKFQKFRAIR